MLKIKNDQEKFITPEEFQRKKFDWKTEWRRKVEHWVAKRAEKVIVPSEYLKKIVENWGVAPEKIRVIYNSFEPPEIKDSKEELRKILKLDGTVLISAGRLVPWKGFKTLIKAIPALAREFPDLKLLIAGEGPEWERLQLTVDSLQLTERVILLGQLPQNILHRYIKAADLFVLNTGYEGLSHQLLEVMELGTPIITTDVGGNPELIEQDRDGLLVPPNAREALIFAATLLLKDKKKMKALAWNAQHKVKNFNKEKMIKELVEELQ